MRGKHTGSRALLDRLEVVRPRLVVTGARMLRAYSYMREPGHSLLDVATKLGYTQQQLRRSMVELVGQTPVRVRAGIDAEHFVSMLARS